MTKAFKGPFSWNSLMLIYTTFHTINVDLLEFIGILIMNLKIESSKCFFLFYAFFAKASEMLLERERGDSVDFSDVQ